jgi:hypothetical protein
MNVLFSGMLRHLHHELKLDLVMAFRAPREAVTGIEAHTPDQPVLLVIDEVNAANGDDLFRAVSMSHSGLGGRGCFQLNPIVKHRLMSMWLNLFAHLRPNEETLYSAHACAAKEETDGGGMQSRPPERWPNLHKALQQAGLEEQVITELKRWLDQDPVRPVQVEITKQQAGWLGLDTTGMVQ